MFHTGKRYNKSQRHERNKGEDGGKEPNRKMTISVVPSGVGSFHVKQLDGSWWQLENQNWRQSHENDSISTKKVTNRTKELKLHSEVLSYIQYWKTTEVNLIFRHIHDKETSLKKLARLEGVAFNGCVNTKAYQPHESNTVIINLDRVLSLLTVKPQTCFAIFKPNICHSAFVTWTKH